MGPRSLITVLAACSVAAAQSASVSPQALDWVNALSGRFLQIHNRVVATWATARVANLVCSYDKATGEALFRKAIEGLHSLPDDAFDDPKTLLPAGTFTALWKMTLTGALKCNADAVAPDDRANWKLVSERGKLNDWLKRAAGQEPDIAAQFIDDALSLAEPGWFFSLAGDRGCFGTPAAVQAWTTFEQPHLAQHEWPLNLEFLERALRHVREEAPDLSDDLFRRSIDYVTSSAPILRSANGLANLGSYLFGAPQNLDRADAVPTVVSIPTPKITARTPKGPRDSFYNLMAIRPAATPDSISGFITTAIRQLQSPELVRCDMIEAFALAYNLKGKVPDSDPQSAADLEMILSNLAAQLATDAILVQSALGPTQLAPEAPDAADRRSDFALITKVRAEANARRFDSARSALRQIKETRLHPQLDSLVDFLEAAQARDSKDFGRLTQLATGMRPGIKREMLLAASVSNPDRDAAQSALATGLKESEALPPVPRLCALAALSAAALPVDPEESFTAFRQLIAAANDAAGVPPRSGFSPKSEASTDLPYVLCGNSGATEAVETRLGRQVFQLELRPVSALTLETFLPQAKTIEFARLEAAVWQLRDDFTLARALVALAELRLKLP
jgi:hypothetical protein